jgi:hypothetical protein
MATHLHASRLATIASCALTVLWAVPVLVRAQAPPVARAPEGADFAVTLYVKETKVIDGRGTTVLLEIVNTSGKRVHVNGPPIVRRLHAATTQATRRDVGTGQRPPSTGPVAPDRLPAESGKKPDKPDLDPDEPEVFPQVTCTLPKDARPRPIVRSGPRVPTSKLLFPGESYYVHIDVQGDELAPGVCRIEATLLSRTAAPVNSQPVEIQCVALPDGAKRP